MGVRFAPTHCRQKAAELRHPPSTCPGSRRLAGAVPNGPARPVSARRKAHSTSGQHALDAPIRPPAAVDPGWSACDGCCPTGVAIHRRARGRVKLRFGGHPNGARRGWGGPFPRGRGCHASVAGVTAARNPTRAGPGGSRVRPPAPVRDFLSSVPHQPSRRPSALRRRRRAVVALKGAVGWPLPPWSLT